MEMKPFNEENQPEFILITKNHYVAKYEEKHLASVIFVNVLNVGVWRVVITPNKPDHDFADRSAAFAWITKFAWFIREGAQ